MVSLWVIHTYFRHSVDRVLTLGKGQRAGRPKSMLIEMHEPRIDSACLLCIISSLDRVTAARSSCVATVTCTLHLQASRAPKQQDAQS